MANFQTRDEVDALIDAAGGPSELARKMGFDKNGGRGRVSNWRAAGAIPPMVVKAYLRMFRQILRRAAQATDHAPGAPGASAAGSAADTQ